MFSDHLKPNLDSLPVAYRCIKLNLEPKPFDNFVRGPDQLNLITSLVDLNIVLNRYIKTQ